MSDWISRGPKKKKKKKKRNSNRHGGVEMMRN
jgi:hypothetical protein